MLVCAHVAGCQHCITDCLIPWVAVISMLCLGDLALNFLRSMFSASWQERAAWATSDFARSTAEGAKQVQVHLTAASTVYYMTASSVLHVVDRRDTMVPLSVQAVHKLAEWHDDFLSTRDPVLTLRVAAALSAASILGSYFRHVLVGRLSLMSPMSTTIKIACG